MKRKRSNSTGRARYTRQKTGTLSRAKRANVRTVGYIDRFNPRGGELKFLDQSVLQATVTPAGDIMTSSINTISQGTGQTQRIGRKCTVKAIYINFTVLLHSPTSNVRTSDIYRIMIYQDKQCNGASAAVNNLLQVTQYNSHREMSETMRFRTLYDKTRAINTLCVQGASASTFLGGTIHHHFSVAIKCNIPIMFTGTTGAIAEIKSNNIGIMVIGEKNLTTVSGRVRIRFSDN